MELNYKGIKQKEAFAKADIRLPLYDAEKVAENTKKSPQWLHFGAGNIFRIFIGGIAQRLIENGDTDKGIVCAEAFDCDVIEKIYKPFDNLILAVTLRHDGSKDKRVIGSVAEALITDRDLERLKEIFKDPGLQMVSFTITEKGYSSNEDSAMGILCCLLLERYNENKAPIAVVSMDNCSHNGERIKSSVLAIAEKWLERGKTDKGFIEYINNENIVAFPWTMIDKITPRPSKAVAAELEDAGLSNMQPIVTSKNTFIAPFVNAEETEYLVIEDKFPNGRPPLENGGVYMTDRDTVNKVEKMKVTACLNPLHTALAVYGCLLGYTLISEEMKDPELRRLVEMIGLSEGLPVVDDPKIISPKNFADEVLNIRIPNAFMPDSPQRIATDTSQKVGVRFGETIKAYVEKYGSGERLVGIPLAIAGWCRYLLGTDDQGNEFQLSPDPLLYELRKNIKDVKIGENNGIENRLKPILSDEKIFGVDLYLAGIGDKIEGMAAELSAGKGAVRNTLKKYLGNYD